MDNDNYYDCLQLPPLEGAIYVVAGKDDDEEIGEVIFAVTHLD